MANLTKLKIVTPHAQTYEQEVYSIEMKTNEGRIAILPQHNPLMAPIEDHIAFVREKANGPRKGLLLLEGIVYVEKHQVRIFSDYFKYVDDIKIEDVQKQLEQLQKEYEMQTDDKKKMQISSQIKLNQSILKAYKEK